MSILKGLHRSVGTGNECARCGRETVGEEAPHVETEQGFFPVGPACAIKLRKQGYNVEAA